MSSRNNVNGKKRNTLDDLGWWKTAQTCLDNYSLTAWGMQEVEAKLTECWTVLGTPTMLRLCQEYTSQKVMTRAAEASSDQVVYTDRATQASFVCGGWKEKCDKVHARVRARIDRAEASYQTESCKSETTVVSKNERITTKSIATEIVELEEQHLSKMAAEILAVEDSYISKVTAEILAADDDELSTEDDMLSRLAIAMSAAENYSTSKMAAEILATQKKSLSKMVNKVLAADCRCSLADQILAAKRKGTSCRRSPTGKLIQTESSNIKAGKKKKSILQTARGFFSKTKIGRLFKKSGPPKEVPSKDI